MGFASFGGSSLWPSVLHAASTYSVPTVLSPVAKQNKDVTASSDLLLSLAVLLITSPKMAHFLRGKQAGVQGDLSTGVAPDFFVLDDVCRFEDAVFACL